MSLQKIKIPYPSSPKRVINGLFLIAKWQFLLSAVLSAVLSALQRQTVKTFPVAIPEEQYATLVMFSLTTRSRSIYTLESVSVCLSNSSSCIKCAHARFFIKIVNIFRSSVFFDFSRKWPFEYSEHILSFRAAVGNLIETSKYLTMLSNFDNFQFFTTEYFYKKVPALSQIPERPEPSSSETHFFANFLALMLINFNFW